MTVIHTRCCAFLGRKPIQDRGGHVRQLVDMLPGEEEESIEYLLMPRRRNFDALVRKNGTFHIGNDFVEISQRRFPRLGCEPVQIDAEKTPSKGC